MNSDWKKRLMTPELKSQSGLLKKMQDAEPKIYEEILRIHAMGVPGIVAGGFASYLLGLTNKYSDVDFFTESFDGIMALYDTGDYKLSTHYERKADHERIFKKNNIIVLNHKYDKLQIIYIRSDVFSGLEYYTELIRCFDIPTCQKGVFVVLPGQENVDTNTTYYIDQNHPFIGGGDTKLDKLVENRLEVRLAKYAERFVCSGETESLRSLCQTVVRKQDPDYKMIRVEHYN